MVRALSARLLLAAWLLAALPAAAPAAFAAEGYAVPIGGALSYENDAVWSRLVALAGGRDAKFVVLAMASTKPEQSAKLIVDALQRRGAVAEYMPIAAGHAPSPGLQRQWLRTLAAAQGVYFAGGAQERIVDTLAPRGHATALLEAIRDVHRRGGVIAGTSAGAAIMGEVMFRDAQDVLPVLQGRMREGIEIDRGLGFAGPDLFVDQHFLRRGRLGRMLPLMQAKGITRGVGVEEDSAAILHANTMEVVGSKGALLVGLADSTHDRALGAFNLRGARLSFLGPGDRADLRTLEVVPSPAARADRIDPQAADFRPYHDDAPAMADILAEGAVLTAMTRLLDSPAPELRALAFALEPATAAEAAAPGFVFRFYKAGDTRGWLSTALGGERYTIEDIRLDVVPVRIARPLYTPWRTAKP